MPSYKNQHFLSASYLGSFSSDAHLKLRMRKLFRTDEKTVNRRVVCKDECAKDYFYSKDDAKTVETNYGESEEEYVQILKELKRNIVRKSVPQRLLNYAFGLHLRNIAYENLTEDERREAQDKAEDALSHLLVDAQGGERLPIEEHFDRRTKLYDIRIFRVPDSVDDLITSDNPSIILAAPDDEEGAGSTPVIYGGVLPMTPRLFFAYAHKKRYRLGPRVLTEHEVGSLNSLQVVCSHSAIYSDSKISSKDYNSYLKTRKKWTLSAGEFHRGHFRSRFARTNLIDNFSFFNPVGQSSK